MAAQPKEVWATRAGVSTEVKMPTLETRFGGFTGFPWAVWAGYESYDDTTNNETITAYTVGAVIRPKLGPLATNFTLNYATNLYQGDGAPQHDLSWFWPQTRYTWVHGIIHPAQTPTNLVPHSALL